MTLDEARAAKEVVKAWLEQHPEIDRDVNGIGITRADDGGYAIRVDFENERGLAGMPDEIDGIPIKTKFVGRIVAQGAVDTSLTSAPSRNGAGSSLEELVDALMTDTLLEAITDDIGIHTCIDAEVAFYRNAKIRAEVAYALIWARRAAGHYKGGQVTKGVLEAAYSDVRGADGTLDSARAAVALAEVGLDFDSVLAHANVAVAADVAEFAQDWRRIAQRLSLEAAPQTGAIGLAL